jgi:hypothetical protein
LRSESQLKQRSFPDNQINESQKQKTDKMQTNYVNLILSNTGLLITFLALIAILIAALVFIIKVKLVQRSKTS